MQRKEVDKLVSQHKKINPRAPRKARETFGLRSDFESWALQVYSDFVLIPSRYATSLTAYPRPALQRPFPLIHKQYSLIHIRLFLDAKLQKKGLRT